MIPVGVPVPSLRHIKAIEMVGALPDEAALRIDLPPAGQIVRLTPDVVKHILTGRKDSDAEFVFKYMREAIRNPHMIGVEVRDARRVRLVHRVEGEARWLHVALKAIPAIDSKTGLAETWVSTAFPMGASIRLIRNKPTFWHVLGLVEDEAPRAESAPPGVSP